MKEREEKTRSDGEKLNVLTRLSFVLVLVIVSQIVWVEKNSSTENVSRGLFVFCSEKV